MLSPESTFLVSRFCSYRSYRPCRAQRYQEPARRLQPLAAAGTRGAPGASAVFRRKPKGTFSFTHPGNIFHRPPSPLLPRAEAISGSHPTLPPPRFPAPPCNSEPRRCALMPIEEQIAANHPAQAGQSGCRVFMRCARMRPQFAFRRGSASGEAFFEKSCFPRTNPN